MRHSIRPATPEEESLVKPYVEKGETLLGVHDDQNVYAVRQPCGTLRFIDCNTPPADWKQRLKKILNRSMGIPN